MLGELFGYSVDAIVAFLIAWFIGSILAYRFIFIPIVLPFIQRTLRDVIIRIFTKPDKEEKEALFGMLDLVIEYFGSRQISTGNKVTIKKDTGEKDENGEPIFENVKVDEVITPIDLVARHIGNFALSKMKASAGGTKTQIRKMLSEEIEVMGVRLSSTALEAASDGHFGPLIMEAGLQLAQKKGINSNQGDTSSGGWK